MAMHPTAPDVDLLEQDLIVKLIKPKKQRLSWISYATHPCVNPDALCHREFLRNAHTNKLIGQFSIDQLKEQNLLHDSAWLKEKIAAGTARVGDVLWVGRMKDLYWHVVVLADNKGNVIELDRLGKLSSEIKYNTVDHVVRKGDVVMLVPLDSYYQGFIPKSELDRLRERTINIAKLCVGIKSIYDVGNSNCELFASLVISLAVFFDTHQETRPQIDFQLRETVNNLIASLSSARDLSSPSKGLTARIQNADKVGNFLKALGIDFAINEKNFRILRDQMIAAVTIDNMASAKRDRTDDLEMQIFDSQVNITSASSSETPGRTCSCCRICGITMLVLLVVIAATCAGLVPLLAAGTASCSDPGTPVNGTRSGVDLFTGSSLEFTCNEGFNMQGSATRTCLTNRTWSGDQSTCTMDEDECLGEGAGNNCHVDARCTNTDGGFTCTCNDDFSGDGTSCTANGVRITDTTTVYTTTIAQTTTTASPLPTTTTASPLSPTGTMYIIGGVGHGYRTTSIYLIFPAADPRYEGQGEAAPSDVLYAGSAVHGRSIYIVGSYGNMVYDADSGTYRGISSNIVPRGSYPAVFVLGSRLYTVGGSISLSSMESIAVNALSAGWSTEPAVLGQATSAFAGCVLQDTAIVAGGYASSSSTSHTYTWQAGHDTWSRAADLHTARYSHCMVCAEGHAWAIGGVGISSMERYSLAGAEWEVMASLPQARYDHQCVYDGAGGIIVSGGYQSGAKSDIFLYNMSSNAWRQSPTSLSTAVYLHVAAFIPEQ